MLPPTQKTTGAKASLPTLPVTRRVVTFVGLCVYCGLPTPRGPACLAHRDLLALDPFFTPGVALEELPRSRRP